LELVLESLVLKGNLVTPTPSNWELATGDWQLSFKSLVLTGYLVTPPAPGAARETGNLKLETASSESLVLRGNLVIPHPLELGTGNWQLATGVNLEVHLGSESKNYGSARSATYVFVILNHRLQKDHGGGHREAR
jgi:hypothetical protein